MAKLIFQLKKCRFPRGELIYTDVILLHTTLILISFYFILLSTPWRKLHFSIFKFFGISKNPSSYFHVFVTHFRSTHTNRNHTSHVFNTERTLRMHVSAAFRALDSFCILKLCTLQYIIVVQYNKNTLLIHTDNVHLFTCFGRYIKMSRTSVFQYIIVRYIF